MEDGGEIVDLGGDGDQPAAPPMVETGLVDVRVYDPVRQGDGMAAAVFYKVDSKRIAANGSIRHDTVRRRFSDFAWLRGRLAADFPGCVVPPLPAKSMTGAMAQGFIDRRLRGLARFMERVVSHCRLKHSVDLDMFLRSSESDFERAKAGRSHEPSLAAASAGIMSFFQNTLHSVQESLHLTQAVDKSAEDLTWEARQEYVQAFHKSVSQCCNTYQALASGVKEMSQSSFDMGSASTLLAELEAKQNESESSRAFSKIGESSDRVSVLVSHKLEKEYTAFKEPLRDLVHITEAVQEAMTARSNALSALHHVESDLRTKRGKLETARSKGLQSKATEYESELAHLTKDATNAKTTLDRITADLERDYAQFQVDKLATLKEVASAFVSIQLVNAQQICASWQAAADELAR
ncbi:PX domain-containing protein [Plasmodiophora brassicae]|uniref:PX domain-containing protein n=1 Tax=Plasmodiophora brassicae TaxID=37360 RepID=A0A0G4J7H9_PLABS|nr:hypothetical protein PBRA_002961 [Plasmodiophora brassicae]SPQ95442.1 unnamed protein product [Plasmodiophora brassicae]